MEKNKGKIDTRKLVLIALLSALSIILTRYISIMLSGNTIRLSFGAIPIIFSGLLLGPVAGFITGTVSDLIGVLLNPQGGVFHPGFTLSSALTGLIPGLVVYFWAKKKSLSALLIANIIASVAVYVIVDLFLNTVWLTQLYNKAFMILLPARAITHAIITAISIFIIFVLTVAVQSLKYPFYNRKS